MTIIFRKIKPCEDAELTNSWRSDNRVQSTLRSSFKNTTLEQEEYLKKKNDSNDFLHWIVSKNNIAFAYCMAHDYRSDLNRITWGYGIGNTDFLGMGALISAFFYNYFFLNTKIQSIRAEVLAHNKQVLSMHNSMGYEQLKVNQIKTHNYICCDEHVLILERENWLKQPKSLLKLKSDFEFPENPKSFYKKLI